MPLFPLEDKDIRSLVQQAQGGDTEAFGMIYQRFFDAVYRYVAFRLPAEVAEDTVADIFVKAWEKLHTYRVHRRVPFGAWLFRIARHAVIDVYRTHRGFEEMPEELADPDPFSRADARARRQDLLQMVRAAFRAIPRRYQEILLLHFVSDLSHRDIARVLRLTEGTVRILKMRALRRLTLALPSDWKEDM